jgi:cytidylate kinase
LQGESARFEEVLAAQQRRDREDAGRPLGALVKAADAVELCTDGMSFDKVVGRLVEIVERRGNAVAE